MSGYHQQQDHHDEEVTPHRPDHRIQISASSESAPPHHHHSTHLHPSASIIHQPPPTQPQPISDSVFNLMPSPSGLTHNYSFHVPSNINIIKTGSTLSSRHGSTLSNRHGSTLDSHHHLPQHSALPTIVGSPTANQDTNTPQHSQTTLLPTCRPNRRRIDDQNAQTVQRNGPEEEVEPLPIGPLSMDFIPYYILIMGFFLLFTSYSLVQNLSVSLFGASTGSITIGIVYIFFVPSALLAPVMLTTKQLFDNNGLFAMFVGSISYTLLTIACCFASFPLLTVGAILVGSSAGLVWVGYSSSLNAYARIFAESAFYRQEIAFHEQARIEYFMNEHVSRSQHPVPSQLTEDLYLSESYKLKRGKFDSLNDSSSSSSDVTTSQPHHQNQEQQQLQQPHSTTTAPTNIIITPDFDPTSSSQYTDSLLLPNGRLALNLLTPEQTAIIDATSKRTLGLLNSIAWAFLNLDVVFGGLFSYFILAESKSSTPTPTPPDGDDGSTIGPTNSLSILVHLLVPSSLTPTHEPGANRLQSLLSPLSGGGGDIPTDVNSRPLFIFLAFASAIANVLYFVASVKSPKGLFDLPPPPLNEQERLEAEQHQNFKQQEVAALEKRKHEMVQGSKTNLFLNSSNNTNTNNNNVTNHSQQQSQTSTFIEIPNLEDVPMSGTQLNPYDSIPTEGQFVPNDADDEKMLARQKREKNPLFIIARSLGLIYHALLQRVFFLSIPSWFAIAIPISFTYTLFTAYYVKPVLGTQNIPLIMIAVATVDSFTSILVSKLMTSLHRSRALGIFGSSLQFILIALTILIIDAETDSVAIAWWKSLLIASLCGFSDAFTQIATNSAIGMIVDSSGGSGEVKGACFGLSTVFKSTGSIFIFLSGKFISFYTQQWCIIVIIAISIIFQVANMVFEKPIDAIYLQDKYDTYSMSIGPLTFWNNGQVDKSSGNRGSNPDDDSHLEAQVSLDHL